MEQEKTPILIFVAIAFLFLMFIIFRDTSESACYVYNSEGGDRVSLRLKTTPRGNVSGYLDIDLLGKDRKQGELSGEMIGNIANLEWEASAEGDTNKEELIIRLAEGIAQPGFGEMEERDGMYRYVDNESLTYPLNLQETDCSDEALNENESIGEDRELYTNQELGFSIIKSRETSVSLENQGETVKFMYLGPETLPNTHVTDGFVLTVTRFQDVSGLTLRELAQESLELPSQGIEPELFEDEVNGFSAYRYSYRDLLENEATAYVFIQNGVGYRVVYTVSDPEGRGYEEKVREMLETLEF